MKTIYLDYAAATPLDRQVLKAMKPYFSEKFYNPSATYLAAKDVTTGINQARTDVTQWLGVRPSEIVFTAGGTEANNLAIHGIMRQFPSANIVVSAIEHDSVLMPAGQYNFKEARVKPDGTLNLEDLENTIDDQTVVVSIMYANNEIGTIQPIRQFSKLINDIRMKRRDAKNQLPLYLHTDACQAPNYLDLHANRLGVDLMTINSGKIYGPKQCGALFVKAGIRLEPYILGGGQERGLRSGTENTANIVGFSTALDITQTMRTEEAKRLEKLRQLFCHELEKQIRSVIINGSRKLRLPNNVHITLPGHDNERLMMQLDERSIQCAVGSACSASSDEPSHVLAAIGLDESSIRASLRFTMGRGTRAEDIKFTVKTLASLVNGG